MRSCTAYAPGRADAWLALALVPGLSIRRARRLVEQHGSPDRVLALPPAALDALPLAEETRRAWPSARERARAERAAIAGHGARVVGCDDAAYPERLRAIADPPLVLVVRGELDAPDVPAVAVVGARRASAYGRRVAETLGMELAEAGVTVVSGLAAGIDGAAHRGALRGGGRTIAVLATGIDRVYPSWHAALSASVARQGALLTEFPCGTPPLQHHFPQRNRLVAGLALATVVVEAAARSGSLITARHALEQGREVFAVPGPVGVPLHDGPHALIREGATLVRGADDVLEVIAPMLRGRRDATRRAAAAGNLTPVERRVLDALGGDVRHVDDVIRAAGVDAAGALETLLALELRGVVVQEPGLRFRQRVAA